MGPDTPPPPGLARSAASAGAATMTSRVLGVVREQVLASIFGASDAMDAYNVAYRVPNLLRDLFAEGAMSAAFVPTFTRELATRGKPAAFKLGAQVVTALLVVTGVLIAAGWLFAGPLVSLFAEGYGDVPGKLDLTVQLTRVMLPFLTFVALAAVFMGMLNSLNHFFVPALSPAMFNVLTIVCAVLLVPVMPGLGQPAIAAIAIGTVLGGLAQWLIQWPLLRREGFRFTPQLDWSDPALRRVLLLMGPGTLGLAATQINVFVNTLLATGEGTGAVSWLNYAFRLMYLPIGLFGVSIATATTPAISRLSAASDQTAVRRTVADGIILMLLLNVPATIGLAVLAAPIVQLMYERGAFTPRETLATADALQFYAVGLLGYSVVRIASPAFYAIGRNRTPVIVSAITVVANAVLNVTLVRTMGYTGLALGTSIAALLNAGLLLYLLARQLDGLEGPRVADSLARIGVASAAMGLTAYWLNGVMRAALPGDAFVMQIVRLGVVIGGAVGVLSLAASVLSIKEFNQGVDLVLRRFRRRPR